MKVYHDDVLIASYPKSGSTWVRFMVANYLHDHRCDFATVSNYLPDLHYESTPDESLPRPRFIKSHHPFDPRWPRVVYLARDGRDVAVSYYFHALRARSVSDDTTFADFLTLFNEGSIDGFGSWSAHVLSWLDEPHSNLLLLTFDELKADPVACLTRILQFAGLDVDATRARVAAEASSFERMRALEQKQRHEIARWAHANLDIPFVRNGSVGESRRYFTADQREAFERQHGGALRRLGYLLPG